MQLLALTSVPPAPDAAVPLVAAGATLVEVYRGVPGSVGGPYAGAVRVEGCDAELLAPLADVALYRGTARHLRRRPGPPTGRVPGVVVVFGVRARADLDLTAFDDHWRDSHGPKALRHHVGMDDYVQWTVTEALVGSAGHDGFSLCGFPTVPHLRHRFFDSDAGRAVIGADAAAFVDLARLDRVECRLEVAAAG